MSARDTYSSDNGSYTSAQDEPAASLPQSSHGNPSERCTSSPGHTKPTIPQVCFAISQLCIVLA